MPRPEPLDEIQNGETGKTESSPDEKPRFSRHSWEPCLRVPDNRSVATPYLPRSPSSRGPEREAPIFGEHLSTATAKYLPPSRLWRFLLQWPKAISERMPTRLNPRTTHWQAGELKTSFWH
jgi:hypothetical protein